MQLNCPAGEVMPVTLMNLQMNSLTHELYGAGWVFTWGLQRVFVEFVQGLSSVQGADLNDQYAYYHLCESLRDSDGRVVK